MSPWSSSNSRSDSGPADQDSGNLHVQRCLDGLACGDEASRNALVSLAICRMQQMAHRMLQRSPKVRRWEETDDVVQRAALRLHRALGAVAPEDGRRLLGLMALQVRRTLLDLARKYSAPDCFAAHHDTNTLRQSGEQGSHTSLAAASNNDTSGHMERWTRFHEVAAQLPDEERELFDLVWYMGLQQRDVATSLGCSVRTVKRRWESVKERLNELLGEAPPIDADKGS